MDGSALPGSRRDRKHLALAAIVIVLLALGIFAAGKVDSQGIAQQARDIGLTVLAPARWVGSLPGKWQARRQADIADEQLRSAMVQVQADNRRLRAELLQMQSLRAEVDRLRGLLAMRETIPMEVFAVPVARREPLPLRHRLVLAGGGDDGLVSGAAVLAPDGVLGHIESVTATEALVVLTTEAEHAVPAIIERNGAATMVYGTGDAHVIRVSWLPKNADIRVGDVLLTSGLGGRYPARLPIARISSVDSRSGERFLDVLAEPLADPFQYPEVLVTRRPAQ